MAEEFLLLCFDDQTGKKIISSDKIERRSAARCWSNWP